MAETQNPIVAERFNKYPDPIKEKLLYLRHLILETASELENVGEVKETLKWGEPSYLTSTGSTIRIGWRASNPDKYGMYFNCKTTLVDTFRELYRYQLCFEGNRAIMFGKNDVIIPVDELKHCISLSLEYHRLKHLPMLGA